MVTPPGKAWQVMSDGQYGWGPDPNYEEPAGPQQENPPTLDFSSDNSDMGGGGDFGGHERAQAAKQHFGRGGGMTDYGDPNFDPRGTDRGVVMGGGPGGGGYGGGGGAYYSASDYDRMRGFPLSESSDKNPSYRYDPSMFLSSTPTGGGFQTMGGGSSGGVAGGGLRAPMSAGGMSMSQNAPMPALPNTQPAAPTPYQPTQMPNQFFQRLYQVLDKPGSFESDPAYQFLFNKGMDAFNRTAGARRQRFAGKTGLDAQAYGQGMTSQYWGQLANQWGTGAKEESARWQAENDIGLRGKGQEYSIFPARMQDSLARDRAEQGRQGEMASSFFNDTAGVRAGSSPTYSGYTSSIPSYGYNSSMAGGWQQPVSFNTMGPEQWQQNRNKFLQYNAG